MHKVSYLLVLVFCIIPAIALAQTPFDAFSPETSRIILDGDSIAAWRAEQQNQLSHHRPKHTHADTILCALIADLRNEQLLLVDIATHRPVAYAPFTDEIKNWLSVDPLVDKNITTSPYLYCNGNPIMFIDPDGRDWTWGEDEQNYVWLDAAISVETTPQGYRYVGADNDALLADAGLRSHYQTLTGKRIGVGFTGGGDKNVGPYGNGIRGRSIANVLANVGVSVAVSIGTTTAENKGGIQFDGFIVTVTVAEQVFSSSSDLQSKTYGAFTVSISGGGKENNMTCALSSPQGDFYSDGMSQYFSGSIFVPSSAIGGSRGYIQNVSIELGSPNPSIIRGNHLRFNQYLQGSTMIFSK